MGFSRMRWAVCGVLACWVWAETAVAGDERKILDGVAARVNGHLVTVGEVLNILRPEHQRIQGRVGDDEYRRHMRRAYDDTLQSLVEKYLILDSPEAAQIQIPDWFVERRIETIIQDAFGNDRTRLLEVLARDRQTYEEWRDEVREHVKASTVRSMAVEDRVKVSPLDVRKAYEAAPEKFLLPLRVRLRMLVLDGSAPDMDAVRALADALMKRLSAGEDFAALARTHSSDVYAARGGDWGVVEPAILNPALRDAVMDMKSGEVRGPLQVADQFYVLKVDERMDPAVAPFEQVQGEVERELRRAAADQLYKEWMARLRKSAFVTVPDLDPFP